MTRCDHNCQTHDYQSFNELDGTLSVHTVCDACCETLWVSHASTEGRTAVCVLRTTSIVQESAQPDNCRHNNTTSTHATPLPGNVLRLDTVCDRCGETLWSDMQPAGEGA